MKRPRRAPKARRPPGPDAAPAVAWGLLALALLVAWLPSWAGVAPKRFWQGYRLLLVRADVVQARGAGSLAARVPPGTVSEATARIQYWDFTGLATVAYSEIPDLLDRMDPRFDAYIEGAAGYFHASSRGTEWRVFYVPDRSGILRFWLRMASGLGVPAHGEWLVPELDPWEKLAALLAVVLLCSSRRRHGLALALGGVAAAGPLVLEGGLAELGVALITLLAWFEPLRVAADRQGATGRAGGTAARAFLLFGTAALSGILLLIVRGAAAMIVNQIGLSLALFLLVSAAPFLKGRPAGRRGGRHVFDPVPILHPPAAPESGMPAAVTAVCFLFLLTAAIPLVRGVSFPVPSGVPGAWSYTWKSLSALDRIRKEGSLPDLAALVTHHAYQEAITFGRPWRLPKQDEKVLVREFTSGKDVISARDRTVKIFDAGWLAGIRRGAEPESLDALLFAQPRAVAVAREKPGRRLVRDLPAALAAAVVLFACLFEARGRGPLIRVVFPRLNIPARRNQVP